MKKNFLLVFPLTILLLLPVLLNFTDQKLKPSLTSRVVQVFTKHWQDKVDRARVYYENKEFDKAETSLERIVETIPCDQVMCRLYDQKVETLLLLASLQKEQENLKKASQAYTKLNELVPRNHLYHYQQGLIESQRENHQDALDIFEKALSIYPDHLPSVEAKIKTLSLLGFSSKMSTYYQEFLSREHFYPGKKMIISTGNKDLNFPAEGSVNISLIYFDDQYHVYFSDFQENPLWQKKIKIDQLKINLINDSGTLVEIKKLKFFEKKQPVLTVIDFSRWQKDKLKFLEQNSFQPLTRDSSLTFPTDKKLPVFDSLEITIRLTKTLSPDIIKLVQVPND